MTEELWKPIKGYKGLYEVSNLGRVKRLPYKSIGRTRDGYRSYIRSFNGGILKGTVCKNGYVRVTLTKDSVNKYYHVHRLVATAFLDNPKNLPQINHKDENRTNNLVNNLEWCSCKYNNQYNDGYNKRGKTFSKNHEYPVKIYSISGEYIKTFPSINDAVKATGLTHSSINRAIAKTRKTAAGYIWEKA